MGSFMWTDTRAKRADPAPDFTKKSADFFVQGGMFFAQRCGFFARSLTSTLLEVLPSLS